MTFDPQMYDILDQEEQEEVTCKYCDDPPIEDRWYSGMCVGCINEAEMQDKAERRWEDSRYGW